MSTREFGTCFFERYAQVSLSALLGSRFDTLENRDRPDLQSPDGRSIGIEVTRAMEENKAAEEALLKDLAGISIGDHTDEYDRILENGYGFGLEGGKYIGKKEFFYWSMALPFRRILESKVAKVGNGFYGRFDEMGLFVFSRENLGMAEAVKAMKYTLSLQKHQELRYNRLYLADVDDLFVCNLDDGLNDGSRIVRYRVSRQQRQTFYQEAVDRQRQ